MLQKSGCYVSSIKTIGFGSLLLNTRSKNELKTIPKSLQKLVRFQIALLSAKSFENDPKRLPNRSNFGILCWSIFVFFAVGFQVGSKSVPRHPPDPQNDQKRSSKSSKMLQKCQKMSSKTFSKTPCSTSNSNEHRAIHTQKTQKTKHCHGATQTQKTLEVRRSRASVLNKMRPPNMYQKVMPK